MDCKRASYDHHWCTTHRADFASDSATCVAVVPVDHGYAPSVLWTPAGPAWVRRAQSHRLPPKVH